MKLTLNILFLILLPSLVWGQYAQNQIIVQLVQSVDYQFFEQNVQREFPSAQIQRKRTLSKSLNIHLIEFNEHVFTPKMLVETLSNSPNVVLAQVNHTNIGYRKTPNDLSYPLQWSLRSTAPGRVFAPEAWNLSTGGTTAKGDTIVVAVIDAGIDLNHVDLDLFKNIHEIPNNGIDDDNNGYVDDYDGWNAAQSTGQVAGSAHGTQIAGVIGARGNNTTGIAGVNWNVKILPVALENKLNDEASVVEAYAYVHEMRSLYNQSNGTKGAYIVVANSSFGINYEQALDFPIWCSMYDSLGKVGVISVAATANLHIDVDVHGDMPTTCPSPYLVAVTATTLWGELSHGTAYSSTHIDLGAPGIEIHSTLPSNNYGSASGTSLATPHVAGAVALMYSAYCEDVFDLFQNQEDSFAMYTLNKLLLDGIEPENSLVTSTTTGGRLNLYKAVASAKNFDCMDVEVFPQFDTCGLCEARVHPEIKDGMPPYSFTWSNNQTGEDAQFCAGNYSVTVVDSFGYSRMLNFQIQGNVALQVDDSIVFPSPNQNDGSIHLTLSGGTPPYTIVWNTGAQSAELLSINQNIYSVTVTDANDCAWEKTYNLSGVGNRSEENMYELLMYPNPANDILHIRSSQTIQRYKVYTLQGQLLSEKDLTLKQFEIPISHLTTGLYILEIEPENKVIYRKRFIKH